MSVDLFIVVADDSVSTETLERYLNPDVHVYGEQSYAETRKAVFGDEIWGYGAHKLQWVGEFSTGGTFAKEGSRLVRMVPRSVEHVKNVYDDGKSVRVMTPALLASIMVSFNLPHDSYFEQRKKQRKADYVGVAQPQALKKFLTANMGKRTFLEFD